MPRPPDIQPLRLAPPTPDHSPIPASRSLYQGPSLFAVAADAGSQPRVRVYDADQHQVANFLAYAPAFTGGVRLALGDLDADGDADVLTAPGPGAGSILHAFDAQTGHPLPGPFASLPAFDPARSDGAFVALADMNGDGFTDVLAGSDGPGPSTVRVFDGRTAALLTEIDLSSAGVTGGARLAAGDVNGDGSPDLVVGAGGTSRVVLFDGRTGAELYNFFAFDPFARSGVTVACADLNGDGLADIVTGSGPGQQARVRAFSGQDTALLADVPVYDASFTGGVRMALADATGDSTPDIAVTPGRKRGGKGVRNEWHCHARAADRKIRTYVDRLAQEIRTYVTFRPLDSAIRPWHLFVSLAWT